jgi:hypothetical protein
LSLVARCILSAVGRPSPDFVLVLFSCTLLLWTIAFSPYSTEMRFVETFFLLVVMTHMERYDTKIEARREPRPFRSAPQAL